MMDEVQLQAAVSPPRGPAPAPERSGLDSDDDWIEQWILPTFSDTPVKEKYDRQPLMEMMASTPIHADVDDHDQGKVRKGELSKTAGGRLA